MNMETNETITIYYFTATGNSLTTASVIASRYKQSKLVKINRLNVAEHPYSAIVGFVFPVYMGGVPPIVYSFLNNFPFRKDVYYFCVATYYTYKGNTLSVVNKITKNKGVCLNYGNYVPTVGNCLKEYEVSAVKRPAILERADAITNKIADAIKVKTDKRLPKHCGLSEKLHKGLFNLFFNDTYKKFILENNCIGCGICSKVCPVDNIVINNKQPQWGVNCASCHACVHWCPKNAISLGKSKGRLQYHNPNIRIEDLLH